MTFTQFKCILSFAKNMKHSNRLKWHLNVVLIPALTFECLIIKRNCKSHGLKLEELLLYQKYALLLPLV